MPEQTTREALELRDKRSELLEVRGALSPGDRAERPIPPEVDITESVLPGVEWLIARIAELEAERARVRSELEAKLAVHRGTSTRWFDGEYKNPTRKGYDIALTEALGLLGVDATERKAGRA